MFAPYCYDPGNHLALVLKPNKNWCLMQSLTELQNTAFLAIGPARIAALSLLSLISEQEDTPESRAAFDLSVERLQNADKMLKEKLPEYLAKVEHELPAKIDEKRLESIELLTPLLNAVAGHSSGRGQGLSAPSDAFRDHCLFKLEPGITAFLTDLTVNLLETQAARNQARETEMLQAITNAENVGRNIQLIAFNASIEAARIGDMGKGFAVIATEIRELSGKTQILLDDIAGFLRS